MKWNKFTLKTRTDAEDIIISTLADIGIQGAEIEDKQPLTEEDKKQMFVDILPDMPEDDGVAYLNFYLDEDENVEEMLQKVEAELEELRNFVDIGHNSVVSWGYHHHRPGIRVLPEQLFHILRQNSALYPQSRNRLWININCFQMV